MDLGDKSARYHKSSIKPPEGAEGGGGDLFNFEKTMVLVLYKDLEYKVDKLK